MMLDEDGQRIMRVVEILGRQFQEWTIYKILGMMPVYPKYTPKDIKRFLRKTNNEIEDYFLKNPCLSPKEVMKELERLNLRYTYCGRGQRQLYHEVKTYSQIKETFDSKQSVLLHQSIIRGEKGQSQAITSFRGHDLKRLVDSNIKMLEFRE